jgi:hypothetical protein
MQLHDLIAFKAAGKKSFAIYINRASVDLYIYQENPVAMRRIFWPLRILSRSEFDGTMHKAHEKIVLMPQNIDDARRTYMHHTHVKLVSVVCLVHNFKHLLYFAREQSCNYYHQLAIGGMSIWSLILE